VPEILETGTQNHEGIVGAAAAVEFLARIGGETGSRRERLTRAMRALHARGEALLARLWEGLGAIDGITLHGPLPGTPRTPTIAFRVAGHSSEAVARFLAPRGVYVSHGDFYATTVARRLGVTEDGLVRAGCSCYTTMDEVERLIAGVQALVHGER
jgi:selenocysteine lyase/cysteine desulfurase